MKKRTQIISALFTLIVILCLMACNGCKKESPEEIVGTITGYYWELCWPAGGIYEKDATYKFCQNGILLIHPIGENTEYRGKWSFDKKDVSLLIEFEHKREKKRIKLVEITPGWEKLKGKFPDVDVSDDFYKIRIFTGRDADSQKEFLFKNSILWS